MKALPLFTFPRMYFHGRTWLLVSQMFLLSAYALVTLSVAETKHHGQGKWSKKEFIWASSSWVLESSCGEAWQQAAGMVAGAGCWEIISCIESMRQRGWTGNDTRLLISKPATCDILFAPKLHPLNCPKQHFQLGTRYSNTRTYGDIPHWNYNTYHMVSLGYLLSHLLSKKMKFRELKCVDQTHWIRKRLS